MIGYRKSGNRKGGPRRDREALLAWCLAAPALALIFAVALFPALWTLWESLHVHDLRMPWRGRPFVGLGNYLELATDRRFWQAMLHTAGFVAASVTLEMILGLALALALHRPHRLRGLLRTTALLPWAIPTVVTALVWRFIFEEQAGIANALMVNLGLIDRPLTWLADPVAAWIPVVLADVWKTTPFVAVLLLAGLQTVDETLYEAARIDGAGWWQQLIHITLPSLKPAILVALIFRTLDAFRVFDLIYVLTGGGPGTATEPIALYSFSALLQNLRFGYGSAMGVVVFATSMFLAILYIRRLGLKSEGRGR
ncbi:Trehalose transport system permease protein SugA [bacterium HR33]|nr:Trehalose transport system permease protein SugA [bacterium HR33]